ncbi:MAG: Zn-ribbon domain-containing OB-fold protein [Acidimicrobiales bacterium]
MNQATNELDPRPVVRRDGDRFLVAGMRCTTCRFPTTERLVRCPICQGSTEPATFGPRGTVFSATVLRVPVPGRTPPYGLAYVDLDDGPRILAHVRGPHDTALAPNDRVKLSGTSDEGDPDVERVA